MVLLAVVASAVATAWAMPRPVPRVCCRARLPDKGDTIQIGMICADVLPSGAVGAGQVRAR